MAKRTDQPDKPDKRNERTNIRCGREGCTQTIYRTAIRWQDPYCSRTCAEMDLKDDGGSTASKPRKAKVGAS